MMELTATFPTQTLTYWEVKPVVLRSYDLLYVLPEYDVRGMSRPEYRELVDGKPNTAWGLPPTVPLLETPAPVPFYVNDEPSPAYELLFHLFRGHSPSLWSNATVEGRMLGYLKNGVCFTDHTDPTAWNSIVTCGNVLYPTGNKKTMGGELYREVRQLKYGTLTQMKAQIALWPHLICFATNSTRANGGQTVTPFPHTGGNDVPAPLFSTTQFNWIKGSRVRLLGRDEDIPPLYHM